MRVLFVCTGNICRSPMAEGLFADLVPDVEVASAGTLGWNGKPASPHAVAVMAERGLDISAHRSRRLGEALAARPDLIVVMTRVHGWAVAAHDEALTDITFLPAELARLSVGAGSLNGTEVGDWVTRLASQRTGQFLGRPSDEVPDPIGEPMSAFRQVADRLQDELSEVATQLQV